MVTFQLVFQSTDTVNKPKTMPILATWEGRVSLGSQFRQLTRSSDYDCSQLWLPLRIEGSSMHWLKGADSTQPTPSPLSLSASFHHCPWWNHFQVIWQRREQMPKQTQRKRRRSLIAQLATGRWSCRSAPLATPLCGTWSLTTASTCVPLPMCVCVSVCV